jgi:hypothetical protein
LVLILQGEKLSFCIFDFPGATTLKKGKVREHSLQVLRRIQHAKMGQKGINEMQLRGVAQPDILAAPPPSVSPLWFRYRLFLC